MKRKGFAILDVSLNSGEQHWHSSWFSEYWISLTLSKTKLPGVRYLNSQSGNQRLMGNAFDVFQLPDGST